MKRWGLTVQAAVVLQFMLCGKDRSMARRCSEKDCQGRAKIGAALLIKRKVAVSLILAP